MKIQPELQGLSNCVHCGVASPRYTRQWTLYSAERWWVTYVCVTCGCATMVVSPKTDQSKQWLNQSVEHIYPDAPSVATELPTRAATYLQQAMDSLNSPDGSVMLCGSAVDAMLKAKELTEGSVYSRIEKAVTDGLLTTEMGEWAHEVRLGSNNPRHADDETPHMTTADAKRLIEFAKMLGHILYTLPAEVAKGKAKAEGNSQAG